MGIRDHGRLVVRSCLVDGHIVSSVDIVARTAPIDLMVFHCVSECKMKTGM